MHLLSAYNDHNMSTTYSISTGLPLLHQGKVRNMYDIDEHSILMVTTDRMSAFDVIFNEVMPERGKILNEISNFWFSQTEHIIPNHLTHTPLSHVVTDEYIDALKGRSEVVEKLTPLPVEAVVRGYIIGSGWKEYQATGSICGITLPMGMQLAQQLETPVYTPATKAAVGDHDENISFAKTVELLGAELAEQVQDVSIQLYSFAYEYARRRGIIIADTKFEFGIDSEGTLKLMDEILTPDSSRFWDAAVYQVGSSPESYDKQILRDYLETLDWNKAPPPPTLPPEIIHQTKARYTQVKDILLSK